ncbi:MAG TPA: mycofactocin biosynthesis glycosyltransferase MftF, partial [Acidimicrobiales bacterium]|nr:mycofactocin biosynthesis glycosyltransferase MftF [Acidimicrobiales bacterium]
MTTVLDPGALRLRRDEPFPEGVWIDIAPEVRWPAPNVLFGGTPPRLLRLSRRGAALASTFARRPVDGDAPARLARTLTDAGMAVPRPGSRAGRVDVTVVVPVHDRAGELEDCLASLGARHRVVVVDDASLDGHAVAAVCSRHGAAVVRREAQGGPAAARNTGLRTVTTDLVAFVDSDCLPGDGWIESLAAHLVDPLVVGVAPRIVAAPPARGTSLLDMGTRPAPVHPRSGVPYVPAAAVLFRRAPLGDGFDEGFRYGEDVDLVWRLVEAGWRIRYVPAVEVAHRDPVTVVARLRRRFLYGTSVGPLERVHPGAIDHLIVGAGPACAVAGALLDLPGAGAFFWALCAAHQWRRLRPFGVGVRFSGWLSGTQLLHAWIGLGRWCTTFGVPVLAGSVLAGRTRLARRARWTAALLVGSALLAEGRHPRASDRRLLVDRFFGEVAYGTGVVTGCIRAGVVGPLLPRVRTRRAGSESAPRLFRRS